MSKTATDMHIIFHDITEMVSKLTPEIMAMRDQMSVGDDLFFATLNQCKTLARVMGGMLNRSKYRIPVLQMLTGLPIESSKQLSYKTVSVIIDWLVDIEVDGDESRWLPSEWAKVYVPMLEILAEANGGADPRFLQ